MLPIFISNFENFEYLPKKYPLEKRKSKEKEKKN